MVSFEEIPDASTETPQSLLRLLDAEEIEQAAAKMKRPTARMHMEGLAKKLRKEGEALQRVEKSRGVTASDAAATAAPEKAATPAPAPTPPKPTPPPVSTGPFVSIDRFSFDAGGSGSAFVTVYVSLPSVGSIARDLIECNFTESSFDLIVKDLRGKSYRLLQDNLEKDIDTDTSKIVVKADKILIKLAKVKGEYGSYDFWSKLTDTKGRSAKKSGRKEDPQSSIMNLMKDMYDTGDDNMRKVIGESMLKQQQGTLDKDLGDMDI